MNTTVNCLKVLVIYLLKKSGEDVLLMFINNHVLKKSHTVIVGKAVRWCFTSQVRFVLKIQMNRCYV